MEKSAALKEIAKGGSIIFIGYLFIGGFEFLYKVMVARFLSPTGYGLLSLGFGITGFFVIISRLGFFQAFQKFIPEYRTRNNPEKIKGIIHFGLAAAVVAGSLFSVVIYLSSGVLSLIFNTDELIPVLKILSFVIPLYTVIYLLLGIFLSFRKSKERVFLDAVVRAGLTLLLTGAAIFLGGDLYDVCFAYLFTFMIAAVIGLIILKTKIFPLTKSKHIKIEYSRIISFSLPLLFVGFFWEIMHWSDTFFIGYFKEEYFVGLYNAARPLATILLLVKVSLNSLFYPVASEFYTKSDTKNLREVYLSVTRWIFIVTFPVFLVFIVFSKDFITMFFGSQYILAHNAFVILCCGTLVNAFFGALGILLQVHEKQHFIFKVQFLAAGLNVILNVVLIPEYGIEGAAAATVAAAIFWHVAFFLKVKRILKIQYDFKYYKRYIFAALGSLLPFYVLHHLLQNVFLFVVVVFFFFMLYFFVLVVTKSFSREDIEILLLFEKKTGLNLKILEKIMGKYV